MRQGNFLPALDNYTIPWEDTIPAYGSKARVVYEFDPADVLYSHLYPAIARTFRSKGFQWITQFAYDPLEIAQYNTEYPTHFLNLVYTPAKALSMMIATKAALETPRGGENGTYPENTRFGNITVSHNPDLSVYNSPEAFIYTNDTEIEPVNPEKLRQVAGHGSSATVAYDGTGAYFLDATSQPGVWRLEVMPDVTVTEDPFGVTSVNDAKVIATPGTHSMTVSLPSLGEGFRIYDLGGNIIDTAAKETMIVTPGTWILAAAGKNPDMERLLGEKVAGNIAMAEYVAPEPARVPVGLLSAARSDRDLDVNMIPEAWDFRFDYRNPSWDLPVYYCLDLEPRNDETTVVRRRVGNKIEKVPEGVNPAVLKIAFLTEDPEDSSAVTSKLPEGTEIAVVDREGFTYAAPIAMNAEGEASVTLTELKPSKGFIMPAPYPTMVTREVPAPKDALRDWRDMEFVELIIPSKGGTSTRLLLKEIWLE